MRRFVVGLGKKVLIANTLGACVDHVFSTPPADVSLPLAWFALAAYTLQIYFDFSGYSDMAIGLARMFGFRFLENFDFPYVARLDHRVLAALAHVAVALVPRLPLHPAGRQSRVAVAHLRQPGDRVLPVRAVARREVDLRGLGRIHGTFLVLERVGALRRITALPVVRNVYVLAVVMFAWVFFRADSFGYALGYLRALVHQGPAPRLSFWGNVDHEAVLAFAVGCVLATPLVARRVEAALGDGSWWRRIALGTAAVPAGLALIFVASVTKLAAGTYNPFIYFRF